MGIHSFGDFRQNCTDVKGSKRDIWRQHVATFQFLRSCGREHLLDGTPDVVVFEPYRRVESQLWVRRPGADWVIPSAQHVPAVLSVLTRHLIPHIAATFHPQPPIIVIAYTVHLAAEANPPTSADPVRSTPPSVNSVAVCRVVGMTTISPPPSIGFEMWLTFRLTATQHLVRLCCDRSL